MLKIIDILCNCLQKNKDFKEEELVNFLVKSQYPLQKPLVLFPIWKKNSKNLIDEHVLIILNLLKKYLFKKFHKKGLFSEKMKLIKKNQSLIKSLSKRFLNMNMK